MPMARAAGWSSATARMAMPVRLRRKKRPKAARKIRLTAAASSVTGEMGISRSRIGSSRIGRGTFFVSAPQNMGPRPFSTEGRPMGGMIMATTAGPPHGRRARPPPLVIGQLSFGRGHGGRRVHCLDADGPPDLGGAAVLVGDGGGHREGLGAPVQALDQITVSLGHHAAPDF